MRKAEVINMVVEQDLCIGCGMCASQSDGALKMVMDLDGFWIPKQVANVYNDKKLLEICPFNPFPKKAVKTEDEIALHFIGGTSNYDPDVGHYEEIYAGYASNYRKTSSSGGMATYIFKELLSLKKVDAIVVVKDATTNEKGFYEYGWIEDVKDIKKSSKTKYYPVHLSTVIKEISEYHGKVGIVGISCFIKSIRLLQRQQPLYVKKIPFLIGIICGGLKSKYFTDYLAHLTLGGQIPFDNPQYRIKDSNSTAVDYSFGCTNIKDKKLHTLKMRNLPDMWGTGYFKANACDFCEDVASELADISLGDAWMRPYNNEGLGNNVVVVRSSLAQEIINNGIKSGDLKLSLISREDFKSSQRGSFNHRHEGLLYRLNKRKKWGKLVPVKRERNLKNIHFTFKIVQELRMAIRSRSIRIWKKYRNQLKFDQKMAFHLKLLTLATRIHHYVKKS